MKTLISKVACILLLLPVVSPTHAAETVPWDIRSLSVVVAGNLSARIESDGNVLKLLSISIDGSTFAAPDDKVKDVLEPQLGEVRFETGYAMDCVQQCKGSVLLIISIDSMGERANGVCGSFICTYQYIFTKNGFVSRNVRAAKE